MSATTHPPPTAPPEDDPVVIALGDPATRRELLARAMSHLNRWLRDKPRGFREQEAEDIVNEVQKRAWAIRANYNPERGNVRAWLAGFVPRVLAEYCRKLRKAEALPIAFQHRLRGNAVDVSCEGWDLDDALERIPTEERNLVMWAIVDELTHREIGDRLRISEDNSRQRLRRILHKLERIITSQLGEGHP